MKWFWIPESLCWGAAGLGLLWFWRFWKLGILLDDKLLVEPFLALSLAFLVALLVRLALKLRELQRDLR